MEEIRACADPAHVPYPGFGRTGQGRAAVPDFGGQTGVGLSVLGAGRRTATAARSALQACTSRGHLWESELHNYSGLHVEQLLCRTAAGESCRGALCPSSRDGGCCCCCCCCRCRRCQSRRWFCRSVSVESAEWPRRCVSGLRGPSGGAHFSISDRVQEAGLLGLGVPQRLIRSVESEEWGTHHTFERIENDSIFS